MIYSTVNHQELPFSDPTHPPLWWRNTWMVPYVLNHPSVIDYNMHRTVLEPIIGFSDTLCVQARTNLRNLRKSQFVAHTICRPNIKHDKWGGSIALKYQWQQKVSKVSFLVSAVTNNPNQKIYHLYFHWYFYQNTSVFMHCVGLSEF